MVSFSDLFIEHLNDVLLFLYIFINLQNLKKYMFTTYVLLIPSYSCDAEPEKQTPADLVPPTPPTPDFQTLQTSQKVFAGAN